MQTGALIVAAGKSSRMGDFKPMLQLGSISIAQRVINNFRQAGISKVVVVTGYKADVPPCFQQCDLSPKRELCNNSHV